MAGALASCVSRAGPVACGWTHYDVFLSFPGGSNATPESFPGRLHACLAAAGVSVCGPNESQAVGSSSQLPDAAVWRSKICIPILSEDYPSSDWCLRGLVQMMEGNRSARQMVLPIFNRVEPSHLRYLTGSFRKIRLSDSEGVQRAIEDVSMLQGWKVTDGCEEELAKTVVQTVRRYLQPDSQKCLHTGQYNVFLNFRGADTRHNFTYQLYANLRRARVSVFKDDTELRIGEDFGSQILNAISRSTIYIIVLSPNYASSKWCLHELNKMMECGVSMRHRALPIFHNVEPREVRNPRREFRYALDKHEMRGGESATREAKSALREVSCLAGWEGIRISDDELIPLVVQEVLIALRRDFKLDVPENLF
ncbi:uncharacterized protein LOC104423561 [Eucalyptus grandis]|uniref:uncharacterized protein LOC104423561 n=1 Tax=Eucalyptus grandis TaxID=71139 RepID=UPI00192EB1F8|nr:uncharacterized protein LOC104423561 [Eucalyptus grandis]